MCWLNTGPSETSAEVRLRRAPRRETGYDIDNAAFVAGWLKSHQPRRKSKDSGHIEFICLESAKAELDAVHSAVSPRPRNRISAELRAAMDRSRSQNLETTLSLARENPEVAVSIAE
jgi:hypothetical protein